MKVVLFIPRTVRGRHFADGCYWGRGPLQIATFLKAALPDIKIDIIDGNLFNNHSDAETLIDRKADVLGISILSSFAYENGIRTAKMAKSWGIPKVVLGGNHVSYFTEIVLKNRSNVDAVVYGKGEIAFAEIVSGKPYKNIKNLVWRNGDEIIVNEADCITNDRHPLHQDNVPRLDYSLVDVNSYWNHHKQTFEFLPHKAYVTFSHEGCAWRKKTGGCSFCVILGKDTFYRKPSFFWNEIESAVEELGINIVKDYGDSITGDKKWLHSIVAYRPKKLSNLPFLVYARASEIDEESAELLKKLNVKYAFVGYESNSNRQLRRIKKGTTKTQNLKATRLLAANGIGIFAGYVLGTEGENERSLKETYDFAKYICSFADVKLSGASPLAVLPGSLDWVKLTNLEPRYTSRDILDFDEIQLAWFKHFCPDLGNPEEANNKVQFWCKQINKLSPLENRFGWDARSKSVEKEISNE